MGSRPWDGIRHDRPGVRALLGLAVLCFGYRTVAGPSLADRMTGVNGMLTAGMAAVVVHALTTGNGAVHRRTRPMIGDILLVTGSAFILLAAVGILRFSDVFVRMQILSKASTFGLLCVLTGGLATLTSINDLTSLLLAGRPHLVPSPVGSNLLARATYFAPASTTHRHGR